MQTQDILTGIGVAILSLLGFMISLLPALKPPLKHGLVVILKRALITSLGFLIFVMSAPVAIDYLVFPTLNGNWNINAFSGLFCLALPITLLTFFGSIVWYSGRDAIRESNQVE